MRRLFLPLAVLVLASSACSSVLSAAAAVVDGGKISTDDVDREIDARLASPRFAGLTSEARLGVAREVLATLIRRRILRNEAARRGVAEVTQAEIDAERAGLVARIGEGQLQQQIVALGLSPEEVRETLQDSVIVRRLREQLKREGQPELERFFGALLSRARIVVNPRFGDWDALTAQIVDHRFFEPPTVEPDRPAPPRG